LLIDGETEVLAWKETSDSEKDPAGHRSPTPDAASNKIIEFSNIVGIAILYKTAGLGMIFISGG